MERGGIEPKTTHTENKRESVSPPRHQPIYERPHGTLSEYILLYHTRDTLSRRICIFLKVFLNPLTPCLELLKAPLSHTGATFHAILCIHLSVFFFIHSSYSFNINILCVLLSYTGGFLMTHTTCGYLVYLLCLINHPTSRV